MEIYLKVAVISTVFNRREKTKKSILSLETALKEYDHMFYICDDNSTDGTMAMLEQLDCPITVIKGDGDLFWSRGMYYAMQKAVEDEANYYIVFNDDVVFFHDSMDLMINSYLAAGEQCGIVGSTKSHILGDITYGGRKLYNQELILPNGQLQKCDLANWNCFLFDHYTVKKVGLIDKYYEHGLGDFDYSLKMKTAGIPLYVAPDYIGICESNDKKGTYHDKRIPRIKRFKSMISKKNMPIRSRWHYYKKNFGVKGLKGFLWPYIKCTFCILLKKDY